VTLLRYATTERVAVAWLGSLSTFSPSMVGTELPDLQVTDWSATGFLVVTTTGGSSDIEIPVEHPIVGVQCFAVSPDTGVPPWGFADDLAAAIGAGCAATTGVEQLLTLPTSDQNARLMSAYTVGVARRSYSDMGDYACKQTSLALHWVTR
jgi:hypothetical protein